MSKRGDIDRLFRLYYRPLCLYAAHYLSDASAVEDIVQEAFSALWEKMSREDVQSPKSYLYTSVHNSCISEIRKGRTSIPDLSIDNLSDSVIDDSTVERSFSEAALWEAIDRLPRRRRQMLLMEKRDGMSCRQIAEQLGVSEGTVRNQISRALKSLENSRKTIFFTFSLF